MDDICAEAGITKGALFHYFDSKHALGEAALERWVEDGKYAFGSGRYLEETDPLKRALGFVDFAIELSQAGPPGCIAGIFAQELAPTDETLRASCARAFTGMTEIFAGLVAEAKARHAPDAAFDPRSIAQHMFAVFQGAMVLARAYQRREIVAEHLRHFRAYLETQFSTARIDASRREGRRRQPKAN
ncbi:MAG: TetR/AcrR family transcriptional regulator [Rhodospirillaceae bacterium]|nr:TetR/AcrR family transcriptional regulator [Rhodospirillaceae bacterium]